MNTINIINLKEKPQYLAEIAQWIWDFWKKDYTSFEEIEEKLKKVINNNGQLPQIYIAEYNNILAGVIWVHKDGIPTKETLTPTATRMFVKKEFRGRFVDKALLYYSAKLVRNLGYENIYFYTRLKNYYDRKSETIRIGELTYNGIHYYIYSCNLSSISQ